MKSCQATGCKTHPEPVFGQGLFYRFALHGTAKGVALEPRFASNVTMESV